MDVLCFMFYDGFVDFLHILHVLYNQHKSSYEYVDCQVFLRLISDVFEVNMGSCLEFKMENTSLLSCFGKKYKDNDR